MKKMLSLLAMATICFSAQAETVKIAGGSFEIKESILSFNGKNIPVDEDTMYLSVQGKYNLLNKDVVLFSQGAGGNACPATYFFVTVDQGVAKKSSVFGTCSDIPKISPQLSQIVVVMPSMQGKKTTYVYKNGEVTENGKPVK